HSAHARRYGRLVRGAARGAAIRFRDSEPDGAARRAARRRGPRDAGRAARRGIRGRAAVAARALPPLRKAIHVPVDRAACRSTLTSSKKGAAMLFQVVFVLASFLCSLVGGFLF